MKVTLDCPTKLRYHEQHEKYGNNLAEDSFMEALAQGGNQVCELAKLYYPGGFDIKAGYIYCQTQYCKLRD